MQPSSVKLNYVGLSFVKKRKLLQAPAYIHSKTYFRVISLQFITYYNPHHGEREVLQTNRTANDALRTQTEPTW